MKTKRIWIVDGVPFLGAQDAAKAIGSTESSLSNTAHLNEKEHGKGCVFSMKGHTVRGLGQATELPKPEEVPYPPEPEDFQVTRMCRCSINPTPEDLPPIPTREDPLVIELRMVKEELRYLRECLLGRLHSLDEISENVRAIERRIIEEKEKTRGKYDQGTVRSHCGAVGAERLG